MFVNFTVKSHTLEWSYNYSVIASQNSCTSLILKLLPPTGLVVSDVPEIIKNGFICTDNHVMQIKNGFLTNNPRNMFDNALVELLIEI